MTYANVILPLQLPKLLTYLVPDRLRDKVSVGVRVKVPLGKSRTYTAIVNSLTDEAENNVEYKEIVEILDGFPIVNGLQLKLWHWMADYYMCSLGDIYRCAIPKGLKPDTLHEGYRAKTETWLRLTEQYTSEQELQKALNLLKRAQMQQKLLMNFICLSTSDWQHYNALPRHNLLAAQPGCTNALRGLIEKGILIEEQHEVSRIDDNKNKEKCGENSDLGSIPVLSDAQRQAYDGIISQWKAKDIVLLHGVTSSGKTEIYTRLILDVIRSGGQVLFLVPEIALTAQLMQRMSRVLGNKLSIYHSGFSDAERVEIYKKQLSDKPASVIMGARSSLFLPFNDLRLVIVDEEHEPGYRQESPAPRYHARNTAIMLARLAGAKTILGSATPSVESYYNASNGKYGLVTLNTRFGDVKMPEIEVVNIKECRHKKMFNGPFMDPLTEAVHQATGNKEQVIMFQNRRGYSHCLVCDDCGASPRCPNCDVTLTHHRHHGREYLTCHYCGHSIPMPAQCPECGSKKLFKSGTGTERIAEDAAKLFKNQRIARLDTDTTQRKNSHKSIIEQFERHECDILVGTQMVSKGLDFEAVSLVAVLNADSLITMPDFRATERAYQLLEQVSGRAGRRGKQGKVIIQTYDPSQPVIKWVEQHSYNNFYEATAAERQMLRYPPFVRMYQIVMRHANAALLENAAQFVRATLYNGLGNCVSEVVDPVVGRIQNLYYKHIILRMPPDARLTLTRQHINYALTQMTAQTAYHAVNAYIIVDP